MGATQNVQVALFGTALQKLKLGCLVLNYRNQILYVELAHLKMYAQLKQEHCKNKMLK